MYVHPDGVAYLAHPRTASQSTAKALGGIGFDALGLHHGAHPRGMGSRKLTTIRNPWDAAVSWVFTLGPFAPHGASQVLPEVWTLPMFERALGPENHWIKGDRMWWWIEQADAILRFESLEEDLNRELAVSGLGPVELPRIGTSEARQGRHYSEFYTPETQDYIGRRFADEIERFGYGFHHSKKAA